MCALVVRRAARASGVRVCAPNGRPRPAALPRSPAGRRVRPLCPAPLCVARAAPGARLGSWTARSVPQIPGFGAVSISLLKLESVNHINQSERERLQRGMPSRRRGEPGAHSTLDDRRDQRASEPEPGEKRSTGSSRGATQANAKPGGGAREQEAKTGTQSGGQRAHKPQRGSPQGAEEDTATPGSRGGRQGENTHAATNAHATHGPGAGSPAPQHGGARQPDQAAEKKKHPAPPRGAQPPTTRTPHSAGPPRPAHTSASGDKKRAQSGRRNGTARNQATSTPRTKAGRDRGSSPTGRGRSRGQTHSGTTEHTPRQQQRTPHPKPKSPRTAPPGNQHGHKAHKSGP